MFWYAFLRHAKNGKLPNTEIFLEIQKCNVYSNRSKYIETLSANQSLRGRRCDHVRMSKIMLTISFTLGMMLDDKATIEHWRL